MKPIPPCTWIDRSHAATAASAQSDFAAAAAIGAARVVLGDAPGGEERERAAELELHQRRRERMRDRLVGADRLAELLALLRVVDRELERPRADAAGLERQRGQRAGAKLRQQLGAREPPAGLAAGRRHRAAASRRSSAAPRARRPRAPRSSRRRRTRSGLPYRGRRRAGRSRASSSPRRARPPPAGRAGAPAA